MKIFLRMPKYAQTLQNNSTLRSKDFTSLQELPRIFLNVTKAISLFVDIWLGKFSFFELNAKKNKEFVFKGKEIDSSILSSPKPLSNSSSTMSIENSQRLSIQSTRASPTASNVSTSRSDKTPTDNRLGKQTIENVKEMERCFLFL